MAEAETTFERLAGEGADARESRNGLRHVSALTLSKIADGLVDPKLVLTWLAGALGVPAAISGLFVPIREAGALLPQVLLVRRVTRLRHRKWMWASGSAGQGVAAALLVAAGLALEGVAAGIAFALALAALAVSRAACSVSYKDILGKTVEKTRRGAVTGFAGTAASVAVVALALALLSGFAQDPAVLLGALALAAGLWLCAALVLGRLEEPASDPEPDGAALDLTPLREDATLRRFLTVRALLVPTALAPPFLVMLSGQGALQGLGALLLASALASFLASYVWGRLSDVSARRVLQLAGGLGAVAMLGAVGLAALGFAQTIWAMPVALFVLMVAYHGVRQGRSTYLVDMSPPDRRAAYAALSNTVIGIGLLAVGAAGGATALLGPAAALVLFAGLCIAAAVVAVGLPEVEEATAQG